MIRDGRRTHLRAGLFGTPIRFRYKGSSGTNTVTTQSGPPAEVLNNYQNAYQTAQNVAAQPNQPYTGSTVAGFQPMQEAGFNAINTAANAGQPFMDAASQDATNATNALSPTNFGATEQAYQSPYTNQVVQATEGQLNNQNAIQQNQLAGNAATAGAFGGDRQAVAQSVLAGQQQLNEAPTIANLYNTGFQNATNTAEANSWLNSQGSFAEGSLGAQAQNQGLTAANAMLTAGGTQQQQAQNELNVPYQSYLAAQAYPFQISNFLTSAAEGTGSLSGGTGSTTSPGPSVLSQVAGLGTAGIGAYGLYNSLSSGAGAASTAAASAADSGVTNGAFMAADTVMGRGGRIPGFAPGGSVGIQGVQGIQGVGGIGINVPDVGVNMIGGGKPLIDTSTGSTGTQTGGPFVVSPMGQLVNLGATAVAGYYGGPAASIGATEFTHLYPGASPGGLLFGNRGGAVHRVNGGIVNRLNLEPQSWEDNEILNRGWHEYMLGRTGDPTADRNMQTETPPTADGLEISRGQYGGLGGRADYARAPEGSNRGGAVHRASGGDLATEPPDYSGQFNTPLSPVEEGSYQAQHDPGDSFDYDMRGAWKAGATEAGNGHLPDTWKKPNHPTFSTQSQYNGADGMTGGEWVQNGKSWAYRPSATNLNMLGPDGLRQYFNDREPDSQLLMAPPIHRDVGGTVAAAGGLAGVPDYSLSLIPKPTAAQHGSTMPHAPNASPTDNPMQDVSGALSLAKGLEGLGTSFGGGTTSYARGGEPMRGIGGVSPLHLDAGGAAVDSTTPAGLSASVGGNPAAVQLQQSYSGLPTETLQEIAARTPPNSPQGSLVQRALRLRQMNPGSNPAQPTVPQATPQGQVAGMGGTQQQAGFGATAPGFADGGSTASAPVVNLDDPGGDPWTSGFSIPGAGSTPGLSDYMPPGAAAPTAGVSPLQSTIPDAPQPASNDAGPSAATTQTPGMSPLSGPPSDQISTLKSKALAANPYEALLAAGLGMMAGTSPHAMVNIGRGGMAGLQNYDQQRQLAQQDALRQQQAEWQNDYRQQVTGNQGQRNTNQANRTAAQAPVWAAQVDKFNAQAAKLNATAGPDGEKFHWSGQVTTDGFGIMQGDRGTQKVGDVPVGMTAAQQATAGNQTARTAMQTDQGNQRNAQGWAGVAQRQAAQDSLEAYRTATTATKDAAAARALANGNTLADLRMIDAGGRSPISGKPNLTPQQAHDARVGLTNQNAPVPAAPAPGATATPPAVAAPAAPRPTAPPPVPKVGDVQQGFIYKGGPPSDPTSWQSAAP